jgi:hypothetical protein
VIFALFTIKLRGAKTVVVVSLCNAFCVNLKLQPFTVVCFLKAKSTKLCNLYFKSILVETPKIFSRFNGYALKSIIKIFISFYFMELLVCTCCSNLLVIRSHVYIKDTKTVWGVGFRMIV